MLPRNSISRRSLFLSFLCGGLSLLAFGGDGRAQDGSVEAPLATLTSVAQVSFNHDATRLIIRRQTGSVGLWDLAAGTPVAGELGTDTAAEGYIVSPDARRALVLFGEKGARVFDLAAGTAISPLLEIHIPEAAQPRGIFSPDGEQVALFEEKEVSVFRVKSGERLLKTPLASPGPDDEYTLSPQAAFTADGKHCLLMDKLGTVTRYETEAWKPLGKPMKHPAAESAYQFGFAASADGLWAVTYDSPGENGPKGQLQVWDVAKSKTLGKPMIAVNGMDGEFFGDRLLVLPGRGLASVRNLPALKSLYTIMAHDEVSGPSVAVTPDGKWLISWGDDRSVRLTETGKGTVASAGGFSAHVTQVLPLPDSTGCLVVCDNTAFYLQGYHDHYLLRLSFPELTITHSLRITEALHRSTLSPDGSKLALQVGESERERLRLYDAATLKPVEFTKAK